MGTCSSPAAPATSAATSSGTCSTPGREVVVLDDLSHGHRAAVGKAALVEGDFGDAPRSMRPDHGGRRNRRGRPHGGELPGRRVDDRARALLREQRHQDARRSWTRCAATTSRRSSSRPPPRSTASRTRFRSARSTRASRPTPTGRRSSPSSAILALVPARLRDRLRGAALLQRGRRARDGAEIGEDHGDRGDAPHPAADARSILHGGPPTPILGRGLSDQRRDVRPRLRARHGSGRGARAGACARSSAARCKRARSTSGTARGSRCARSSATVGRVAASLPPTERAPRRQGDPAILVASAERAIRRLGWTPAQRVARDDRAHGVGVAQGAPERVRRSIGSRGCRGPRSGIKIRPHFNFHGEGGWPT